ncbi:MAG: biosynthetic peptidoglycan transglycosylase [Thermodesulfobacteriota bacterium]
MALYSVWVVYSARTYTEETLLPQLRAAHYALAPSDLTPRQLDILLKVEDSNFFHHGGVDLSTPGAGITTITQGLVKDLYFEHFQPGIAKYKQTLIAFYVLDPLMPKEEQLRLFLNTVYLGRGARGFAQAARTHFGKPFRELSEDQYIALVAMIIAPQVFDLHKHPARNAERVRRIKRLVSGEYRPRGLMDLYYGKMDPEAQKDLPPFSYFASYYQ